MNDELVLEIAETTSGFNLAYLEAMIILADKYGEDRNKFVERTILNLASVSKMFDLTDYKLDGTDRKEENNGLS